MRLSITAKLYWLVSFLIGTFGRITVGIVIIVIIVVRIRVVYPWGLTGTERITGTKE